MNCNACRYEMSRCLDGRLPSGSRAVVMQHTESCEPCATFWEELQAAQRLTLRLPRENVGESFREQLWERIRAGEGTPEAVFREPVPTLVKARYALTGAAAAAAVLLFGLWLNDDNTDITDRSTENMAIVGSQAPPVSPTIAAGVEVETTPVPMLATAPQLCTPNLYAVETARQIEARYYSVNLDLRELGVLQRQTQQPVDVQVIVDRVLSKANEMRVFAEVLLELRDYDRVSFGNPEVCADLRLVTNMLEPQQLQQQNLDTVTTFVGRTVRQTPRLGNISRHIRITPSRDRHEEAATLIHLNTRRPEVFTKLFFVIGQGDEISQEFGLHRQNHLFLFEDMCGTFFVAPRSEVERRVQRGVQRPYQGR